MQRTYSFIHIFIYVQLELYVWQMPNPWMIHIHPRGRTHTPVATIWPETNTHIIRSSGARTLWQWGHIIVAKKNFIGSFREASSEARNRRRKTKKRKKKIYNTWSCTKEAIVCNSVFLIHSFSLLELCIGFIRKYTNKYTLKLWNYWGHEQPMTHWLLRNCIYVYICQYNGIFTLNSKRYGLSYLMYQLIIRSLSSIHVNKLKISDL